MKLLRVDFNAIQKAMEDVSRDKFDYFLDLESGEVMTISQDILDNAEHILYQDGSPSEEYDLPESAEDEVELAIKIFSDEKRYVRIPERDTSEAYNLMREFAEEIAELKPHDKLTDALNSANAFSGFKKTLSGFPAYRGKWYAFNAKAMKKKIAEWLESVGVKPEQNYYQAV